jgi:flagellar M-ring protein FliF
MANAIFDSINQVLNTPARKRNALIAAVLLVSAVGFGSLIFWNSQPEYQVLFTNLSQEDAGEMLNKIKEKKISFQLGNNGTSILVPKDQVYDVRLSLTAEGLPKGGGIGFEVFDRTNLGVTDFVQKLNYQRALQGELSRTIRQIKEVEQARVHIVTPKETLFIEEQKKPTASVFIKARSGMSLAPAQVEGIVHLVASAVEGLDPGNITVVDTSGKVLSRRSDPSAIGQLTTSQLEYQRNIEEGLRKKIQGMLEEVLGQSKAIARVAADIDFQQIDITEERYDPNGVLRSEQKSAERSSMSSGAKALTETKSEAVLELKPSKGKANLPAETRTKTASGPVPFNNNSSERQNEIRNYEISKVNKHIKNSVGTLKKISVAVIVDGNYKDATAAKGASKGKQFLARPPEEMKKLESLIKKAMGYDEGRGDQVEVINMPFSWSALEEDLKVPGGSLWKEYLLLAYKPVVTLVLAALFLLFVIRPLLKKRAMGPPAPDTVILTSKTPASLPAETAPTPKALDVREQTVQLIQDNPSRGVGIVKAWLNEKETL